MHAADERSLSLAPDVRHDAALADGGLAVAEIIAPVQTQVPGPARATRGTQHHGVERRRQQPLVVHVRRAQRRRERDATPVGADVALGAPLPAVRRVRSREVPPFGALTMKPSSAVHFHAIPRRLS